MKEYHVPFWELNEIPAPFVDDLMHLDTIEATVLEEESRPSR
jgi:hypothetical protein